MHRSRGSGVSSNQVSLAATAVMRVVMQQAMKRKHVGILIIASAGLFLCQFTPLLAIVYHLVMYVMAAQVVYPPKEGLHTFALRINGGQVVGIADGETLRVAVAPFGYSPMPGGDSTIVLSRDPYPSSKTDFHITCTRDGPVLINGEPFEDPASSGFFALDHDGKMIPIQINVASTHEMVHIGSSRSSIPSDMFLSEKESDFSCIVRAIDFAEKQRIADFLHQKADRSITK